MGAKILVVERLGEHVRVVLPGRDMLHDNLTISNKLAHLEIATLNVPRALARPRVLGELYSTLVVYIQHRN